MKTKASNFLLVASLLIPGLAGAVLPVVSHGQNFERDLLLARTELQKEHRVEAQKILTGLYGTRHDERVLKLLQLSGTMFLNQETAELHAEGLRLLGELKIQEARERFEAALSKEPGLVPVMARLIQLDVLHKQWDAASRRLKEALLLSPQSPELKAFSIKVSAMLEEGADSKRLPPLRRPLPAEEVPFVFALEYLEKSGRFDELRTVAREALKAHPDWIFARVWFRKNGRIEPREGATLKTQIERALVDREGFDRAY
ncbi:MAG: hypothetical protein EBX52_07930, partial [Proteobacteria bacterium]|nr:hypothetical protein [Pseudomonadota bacterium]